MSAPPYHPPHPHTHTFGTRGRAQARTAGAPQASPLQPVARAGPPARPGLHCTQRRRVARPTERAAGAPLLSSPAPPCGNPPRPPPTTTTTTNLGIPPPCLAAQAHLDARPAPALPGICREGGRRGPRPAQGRDEGEWAPPGPPPHPTPRRPHTKTHAHAHTPAPPHRSGLLHATRVAVARGAGTAANTWPAASARARPLIAPPVCWPYPHSARLRLPGLPGGTPAAMACLQCASPPTMSAVCALQAQPGRLPALTPTLFAGDGRGWADARKRGQPPTEAPHAVEAGGGGGGRRRRAQRAPAGAGQRPRRATGEGRAPRRSTACSLRQGRVGRRGVWGWQPRVLRRSGLWASRVRGLGRRACPFKQLLAGCLCAAGTA